MNIKKKTLAALICSLTFCTAIEAAVVQSKGESDEVSIQESGGLLKARKLAKKAADRDAVFSMLKLKMNVDKKNPAVQEAIDDMAKQFSDKITTSYSTDGDVLTAKSSLAVEGEELFSLARSIDGLTSGSSTASAKILFLIDEYYGVGTSIQPGQALSTEITYKHDKSSASSSSKSSTSASSSKDAIAVSGSEKTSVAASDSASVSAREKSNMAGSQRTGVAVADGYGNAAAASRDARVSGSSSSSVDAARSSSYAGSSQSNFAGAASSERASASSSASASAASQKDIVNYSFKQTFPGIDNAKPADRASAMIAAKLQGVVKSFGLEFVAEQSIRVEKGVTLLVTDLERLKKFDWVTKQAASPSFGANYIVYGTAVMNTTGNRGSRTTCAGQLALTSYNVSSGDGLIADTVKGEAEGDKDQGCRQNLADALATKLAEKISLSASQDIQRRATQGESFFVSMFSGKKIKSSIMIAFPEQLKAITKEMKEDANRDMSYIVKAKDGFINRLKIVVAQMSEENPDARNAKVLVKGGRVVVSLDGTAPKDF